LHRAPSSVAIAPNSFGLPPSFCAATHHPSDRRSVGEHSKVLRAVPGRGTAEALLGGFPQSPRGHAPLAARRAKTKKWFRPTAHFALYLDAYSGITLAGGEAPLGYASVLRVFKLRGAVALPQSHAWVRTSLGEVRARGGRPETPFYTPSFLLRYVPCNALPVGSNLKDTTRGGVRSRIAKHIACCTAHIQMSSLP
jgi:hypothetical protein